MKLKKKKTVITNDVESDSVLQEAGTLSRKKVSAPDPGQTQESPT
jgi:hypothetical protein